MRKTTVLNVLFLSIFIFACEKNESDDATKSFVSLKNGEKISVYEYEQLRKFANEGGLIIYLQDRLKKRYGMHLSQSEIRGVIYNKNLRVILEQDKTENTTLPQVR
jgi:hypothetical protein